jgi:hypothetical protein
MKVWSVLESDPIFIPPAVTLSTEEEKRLTAKQLVKFLFSGLFDGIHNMDYCPRVITALFQNKIFLIITVMLYSNGWAKVITLVLANIIYVTEHVITYYCSKNGP